VAVASASAPLSFERTRPINLKCYMRMHMSDVDVQAHMRGETSER
jgi:hypothetical protein